MPETGRSSRVRQYIALLDAKAFTALDRAIARDGAVLRHGSAPEILAWLRRGGESGAVIDPALMAPNEIEALLGLLTRADLPVLVYASLCEAGVDGAVQLARFSSAPVFFRASEQSIDGVARALLSLARPAYLQRVRTAIRPKIDRLPRRLQAAVANIFTEPFVVATPASIARSAAVTRRSLDRWMVRVGLASPRVLVAIPPLLRALTLLWDTDLSVGRISQICGYRYRRQLQEHLMRITGTDAVSVRHHGDRDGIIDRLVKALDHPVRDTRARKDPASDGVDDTRSTKRSSARAAAKSTRVLTASGEHANNM